jgi:hypothetical protein
MCLSYRSRELRKKSVKQLENLCVQLVCLLEKYRERGLHVSHHKIKQRQLVANAVILIGDPEEFLAKSSTCCEHIGWLALLVPKSMLASLSMNAM